MTTPSEELRPEITAILGNFTSDSIHVLTESLKQLSNATFIPSPETAPALKGHVTAVFSRITSSKLAITETDLTVLLEYIGLPGKFEEGRWDFDPEQDSITDFGNVQERITQIEDFFEEGAA